MIDRDRLEKRRGKKMNKKQECILKNHLKRKENWLEIQKEALSKVVKNIKICDQGYDWTLFEFHHYQLLTTTGNILLLKKLLNDINNQK